MSLINQVLNDLEKRGVNSPLVETTVRAVPVQNKNKILIYVGVSIVVLSLISILWWALPKVNGVPKSVGVVAPQRESKLEMSQIVATSASQVASQVAAIDPPDATDYGVASRLSFELSSIPLPNSLRGKPLVELPAPLTEVALPAVATKSSSSSRMESAPTVSKQFKNVGPQQLAENEFRKANLLAQQGQLKEAAAGYEAALHIDALHLGAREALVAVLLESKLNSEAEKVLQEGLQQNLKQSHFAMLLARLQVERSALPLALDTLEKSLPYAEQLADYQAFMAAILQRLNRHKEAISHYQIALQTTPSSGLWLMGLGISLQALQRKEDAKDAYTRAIETHSLTPELQAFIAQRMKELKS